MAPGARLALLALLLLGALLGPGSTAAENSPQQVNGIRGESASFPLKLPHAERVTRIDWSFQTQSTTDFLIATFKDGKLEWQNTSGRFGQRLEMAEETTLRIRALEKEDRGVLTAYVVFANGVVLEQTFLLSVFELLPDPQIRHHVTSRTAEACNVTLQCLASEQGRFNISWKRGSQLIVLGEDSGWYRVSPGGTDLHLSWRPNSSDSTFTCLLSNPVDQKNVSFDLLSICPREGHAWALWLLLLLAAVLVVILVAGVGIYLCKKRASQGDYSPSVPEKKGSPELQYVELYRRRSPPEGYENQDSEHVSLCPAASLTVVFSPAQPPPATRARPDFAWTWLHQHLCAMTDSQQDILDVAVQDP